MDTFHSNFAQIIHTKRLTEEPFEEVVVALRSHRDGAEELVWRHPSMNETRGADPEDILSKRQVRCELRTKLGGAPKTSSW